MVYDSDKSLDIVDDDVAEGLLVTARKNRLPFHLQHAATVSRCKTRGLKSVVCTLAWTLKMVEEIERELVLISLTTL